MEFYDVVEKRRTIRDFTDQPVDREVVERILSAGMKAPSNDHLRNWEFVVVTDRDLIQTLLKKIPKQISEKRVDFIIKSWRLKDDCQVRMYKENIPKQYEMLYRSGCLILPFFKQNCPVLEPKSLSSLNDFASIWCCIENILLAVTAEGLGAAFRIPLGEEGPWIQEVLNHPKEYYLPCYIAIGHPVPDAAIGEQIPYNIQDKIHYNGW